MQLGFVLFLLLSVVTTGLYSQAKDIVTDKGLTSALHRSNAGKIAFSDRLIPEYELDPADFLSVYTLTNKSNLFITVFLARSLTNYLHDLAPSLPADSLVKIGNYQFSFYVDGTLLYQTNLWPGAPYAYVQHTETVWSKPLIDNRHEGGLWSQSAWNRFMLNGGDSALTDGAHVLKIELRPYIDNKHLVFGDIIATGELQLTSHRKADIDLSNIALTAPLPYPGLPASKASFDRDKIKELRGNIDAGVFRNITSVVVIKNGELLIEEYFNGANRDSLHDTRSVGKSFASTITGIAIRDGHLKSERETIGSFYNLKAFQHYSTDKNNTSIEQLLTMSASFDGDDDDGVSPGNEENMYPASDWVKFTLDLPAAPTKYSGQWHYFTAGVVLLGDILNKVVPDNLEKYAEEKLFQPLGIVNYKWQYTPAGVANTAGGIRMNALDFAKYGQLYKNNGKWNGQQLIPKQWVDKSFTRHKSITGRKGEFYGYLFWNKSFRVKSSNYETFYCAGNGGNKIFIFKNQPLVIVITATAYGSPFAHQQVDKMMEQFILPSVLVGKKRSDVK